MKRLLGFAVIFALLAISYSTSQQVVQVTNKAEVNIAAVHQDVNVVGTQEEAITTVERSDQIGALAENTTLKAQENTGTLLDIGQNALTNLTVGGTVTNEENTCVNLNANQAVVNESTGISGSNITAQNQTVDGNCVNFTRWVQNSGTNEDNANTVTNFAEDSKYNITGFTITALKNMKNTAITSMPANVMARGSTGNFKLALTS